MGHLLSIEIDHLAPSERVKVWKDLLHDCFIGVECDTENEAIHGSISGHCVAGGSISRSSISRQVLSRTPSLIGRCPEETAIIAVVRSGLFELEQGGKTDSLKPGEICIVDGSRPFEARFVSDAVGHGILHVPKSAVTRRLGGSADAAFATFRADAPLQKLVAGFLDGVTRSFDEMDDGTLDTLLDRSLDLIALMVGQGRPDAVEPSTHRAAMLLRIKSFIREHLQDPNLSIDKAAAFLGISSRYINNLLASEGTSFGRHVMTERLEGARRDILDPRRQHRHVTEIALDWGFTNASHFGRVYKTKFGMTPRDARMSESRR